MVLGQYQQVVVAAVALDAVQFLEGNHLHSMVIPDIVQSLPLLLLLQCLLLQGLPLAMSPPRLQALQGMQPLLFGPILKLFYDIAMPVGVVVDHIGHTHLGHLHPFEQAVHIGAVIHLGQLQCELRQFDRE